MSTVTILAARRGVPPDLMAPAARSPILRKLIRPEERSPPASFSPAPRSLEKVVPVPEADFKRGASGLVGAEIAPLPAPIGPGPGEPLEHLLGGMLADRALLLGHERERLAVG